MQVKQSFECGSARRLMERAGAMGFELENYWHHLTPARSWEKMAAVSNCAAD